MKKIHRLYFFLGSILLTLVVVSSCRIPFDLLSTPTPVPRNAWLTEWLKDPVCQPPCFLGITPGITTITETVQLLSNTPDVRITSGPSITIDSQHQELSWFFTTFTLDDSGRIVTDIGGTVLTFVVSPGYDQHLTISDVISYYGQPSHVLHYFCRGKECPVQIIFLSSGMLLDTFLPANWDENYKHSVEITPDVSVQAIWFFPVGEEGYKMAFPFYASSLSEKLLQWNGYTTYKER